MLTALSTQEALSELGVRPETLSEEEKRRLDQDGYLVLSGILNAEQVAAMRAAMEAQFIREKITNAPGAPDVCALNMQNLAPVFDVCITHPRVLAAVAHVLKDDFKSQGVRSRPNPPGCGKQVMHADWDGPPARPGEYFVCNSVWPLVDFTELNGATRVVPGTHRCGKHPQSEMSDCREPHPREIKLEVPAGSVAVFNGHLWHGATLNRSQADRPNVVSFWSRTDLKHRAYEKNALSSEAAQRLSPPARSLFDGVS